MSGLPSSDDDKIYASLCRLSQLARKGTSALFGAESEAILDDLDVILSEFDKSSRATRKRKRSFDELGDGLEHRKKVDRRELFRIKGLLNSSLELSLNKGRSKNCSWPMLRMT